MSISFVRIDDRVIHGQLVTRWAKELPCDGIVAIDDADRGRSIELRYGLRRGADDHGLLVRAYRLKGREDNRNQQQRERSLTGRNDFHE